MSAKADPNKTPKKRQAKQPKKRREVKREKVGHVRVVEYEDVETGKRYYRTECRRKGVTQKTVSFPSWKKAFQFASKQSLAIETGKVEETDDDTIFRLKQLQEKINVSNILKEESPYEYTYGTKDNTLENVFDAGITVLQSINRINRNRKEAGLTEYSINWVMRDFEGYENRKSFVKKAPKISEFISALLSKKLSPTGGKGNRNLEPKTKKEWRYVLEKINEWIGDLSSEEEGKFLKVRITNGINQGFNKKGIKKDELWSPITKRKFASKANEFGRWMVEEEIWEKNPFKSLPQDFTVRGNTRAETFTAEQVDELFTLASREENRRMIPYLALIFFSGARPEEIADEKGERFEWRKMHKWKNKSKVTGGILFEILAREDGLNRSKGARDRYADLAPSGVKWIKWYQKEVKGTDELPNEGKVDFSRKVFDRIKREANCSPWPNDVARHTFTSLAQRYDKFDQSNANYWLDKCGHKRETYEKNYNAPKTPEECEDYFNITPPEP